MRKLLLPAAALALLSTAPVQAQSYQQLTNSLNGVGCIGSGGTPGLFSLDLPRIDAPFTIQVSGLAISIGFPPGLMAFVYGFSKTQWGGFALPYDLGNLGVFGCFAHVSVDVIIPMTYGPASTTLQFTLNIPNDPSIVGVNFYNQAVFFDPLAQLVFNRQVTVSNAMEGVVGT